MCGIVGLIDSSKSTVCQPLYQGLTVVQHRGQDSAGMMTSDGERVYLRKDNGLVNDVFRNRHMLQLQGHMGIAHARYPTAGCDSRHEAQPFFVNTPFGLAIAHNGNLTNAQQLRKSLFKHNLRQINTTSDSEVLLNVFAFELQKVMGDEYEIKPHHVFKTVKGVHEHCKGAYAVVIMIVGFGLVAFRDPNGIRPLVYGQKVDHDGHISFMVASESVALDMVDYNLVRDIHPGEAMILQDNGKFHSRQCAEKQSHAPCIFEYVYFARPDSVMDGISVFSARQRMGEKLARKIMRQWPDHDIDVVIPIPDSSRTSALETAYTLDIKYREGFVKNRYVGRTFIMPGQAQRNKSVKQKLNAISSEFEGKNVLLIDDSIVRGTTSMQIIQMARQAGARKVYFASAAPPVRFPNVYGIDMPVSNELVAFGKDEEQVADEIGADKIIYQDLEALIEACHQENPAITEFDTSCFSGEYVTGNISRAYLESVESQRSDANKSSQSQSILDLADLTGYM